MRIIPAIDIIDGKCVRLSKGDYASEKIYADDPVEIAKRFEDAGIRYLHVVDLDGAKAGGIKNIDTVSAIVKGTSLTVDFGGGIKSDEDITMAFDAGVAQVTVGSVAAKNPELFLKWIETYDPDQLILGADCRNEMIATNGWTEASNISVFDFIADYYTKGIDHVVATDIDKDGMLEGPSIELYQRILNQTPVKLVASGGITTMKDLTILEQIGCNGAIIGKAIYEGKVTLEELAELC